MQDATAGSYSLQEAATLLGCGVNTLRRRITAGQVRAEQVQRPQGYVWRVYLDDRHPPGQPPTYPADQEAPGSLPQPPTPLAQAEALASLIQATLTPIIAPLVAELAASRQANSALTDQLLSQAEMIGELRAENAVLKAAQASLEASGSTRVPEPSTELSRLWGRSWAVYGALGLLAIAAVIVMTLGLH